MTIALSAVTGYALGDPAPAPAQPPSDLRLPQNRLIYDLIEVSNPGFKAAYGMSKVQFTGMASVTVDPSDPFKCDTSVLVSGPPGSGTIGKVTVRYRRIDMSALFRNMIMRSDFYSAAGSITRAQFIADVNAKYGLSLLETDMAAVVTVPADTVYNGIAVNGLCYKGTVSLQWVRSKRPITEIITDANRALIGRLYPGGNDFSQSRKPVGEWQLYGLDASAVKANLAALSTSFLITTAANANLDAVIAWLNNNSGKTNWAKTDSSLASGLAGCTAYIYTLPSTSIPEANSARFTRAMVIQSVDASWFSGKLILHWNA